MLKAYVFRLYPNDRQRKIINQTIGNSRFIYNYFLDDKVKDLSLRKWECPECHTEHDRDYNAAENIMFEGIKLYIKGIKA